MVGIFARLKLRLLRNGMSRGWQQVVGLVIGFVVAVPLGLLGAASLVLIRGRDSQGAVLVVGSLLVTMAWAVLPVLGFGSDETLDPSRLVLLPLRPGQMLAGLFAASLLGVTAVATMIGVAGAAIGAAPAGPGAVIVVLAGLVLVAQCVVVSRAVVTSLSSLLRSRRGRDITAMLVALAVIAFQGARFLVAGVATSIGSRGFRHDADALRWLPPAWAGEAMAAVTHRRLGEAAVALGGSAVFLVLLLAWWRAVLVRALTRADTSGTPSGRRSTTAALSLYPAWARFLPRNHSGAVAAKELRYAWRDPRRRVQMVVNLAMPVVAVAVLAVRGNPPPVMVLLAAAVGSLVALNGLNSFGLDGPGYWVHVSAGPDPRGDLVGKNLALVLQVLPLVAGAAVALAAVSGGWLYVPGAIVLALACVATQMAVGNVVSVILPQPVSQSSNPWGMSSGQGCLTGLLVMLAMGAEMLLLLPAAVGTTITAVFRPAWLVVVIPVIAAYGAGLWWAGLGLAAARLRGREPELLAKIDLRAVA